jgi:ribosome-associated translation inhibitor RaiA
MAKVIIQARGCEVDEALETHFQQKIESLEHHWSGDVEVHVRLWQHRGRCVSEITLVSAA